MGSILRLGTAERGPEEEGRLRGRSLGLRALGLEPVLGRGGEGDKGKHHGT